MAENLGNPQEKRKSGKPLFPGLAHLPFFLHLSLPQSPQSPYLSGLSLTLQKGQWKIHHIKKTQGSSMEPQLGTRGHRMSGQEGDSPSPFSPP